MSENKQDLVKLLDFIIEISSTPNNNWFRKELVNKLVPLTASKSRNNPEISEIHEYCIKKILQDQAKMFYKDFNLPSINDELCNDFVRMEQYRREDNFEEFCMAMFQQIEQIVNALFDSKMKEYIINNKYSIISSWQDKETGKNTKIELWQYLSSKNLDGHNNENTLNSTAELNIDKLLITLSEKGALICGEKEIHVPAEIRNIADVSGAGDTVIAVASLALSSGLSDEEIVRISNLAGGLVCEKVGVVPVDKLQLLAEAIK